MGPLQAVSQLWLLFLQVSLRLWAPGWQVSSLDPALSLLCTQIMPSPSRTSSPGWRGERSLVLKARGAERKGMRERKRAPRGQALVSGGVAGAGKRPRVPCPPALPTLRGQEGVQAPYLRGGHALAAFTRSAYLVPLTSGNPQSVLFICDLVFVCCLKI